MDFRTTSAQWISVEATRELTTSGVPEPEASAEILLSELLNIRRGNISFHDEPLTERQLRIYRDWISRRKAREPVQRILGYAYFRNLTLKLGDETLIPRPDTECVVDLALGRIDSMNLRHILDIGTGTGAIAIALAQERPACEAHASDVSVSALQVAGENARSNGTSVSFHRADIASGLEGLAGSVDLLISNPPYVRREEMESLQPEVRDWDPPTALDGGDDGLNFYKRILNECGFLLSPRGEIIFEVGDDQAGDVMDLGRDAGYLPGETCTDLTGTVRGVHLAKTGGGS